jgi:PAS domain S-box-containing protein
MKMPYETSEKILFVDDDKIILETAKRQFREQFEMATATSGAEGLELIKNNGPFAVVISDLQMKVMDGAEFINRARKISPESVYIMQSGCEDVNSAMEAVNQSRVFHFLIKPCPQDVLAKTIQDALMEHHRIMNTKRYVKRLENATAQKEAAQILRDREEFDTALFKHNPLQTTTVDLEGKVKTFNQIRGCCDEKAPNIGDVMFKDYANKYESDMFEKLMECIRTERLQKFPEQKYGNKFLSTTISPSPNGAIIIIEDITERKLTEDKIETAAKEWRTTFDSISDLVSIHDTHYRIRRVNKAFANTVGWPFKELLGSYCYEVVHGLDKPCEDCPVSKTLKTKRPATQEIFEPNWGIHWEISTSPIHNDEGQIIAVVHIMKDIRVRKQAEEELMQLNERLKEHDRLKDKFVSTVSHELRTPLSIFKNIISNALAGVMGNISSKMRENLKIADESINRLARIIDDFLDLSKIESGRVQLRLQKLSISSIITEVVDSLIPLAKEKHIGISNGVLGNGLLVNGDYDKMVQVLTNLLDNAIKFTPRNGHIEVTAYEGEREIFVRVRDNGPGITRKDQERIFDRFAQARKSRSRRGDGTGLGLPIAKELVEMHKGRIWVESRLGKGSMFCFTLPKYQEHHKARQHVPVEVESS